MPRNKAKGGTVTAHNITEHDHAKNEIIALRRTIEQLKNRKKSIK